MHIRTLMINLLAYIHLTYSVNYRHTNNMLINEKGIYFSATGSYSTEDSAVKNYIEGAIATFKLKLHQAAQRHEGRKKRSLAANTPLNDTSIFFMSL